MRFVKNEMSAYSYFLFSISLALFLLMLTGCGKSSKVVTVSETKPAPPQTPGIAIKSQPISIQPEQVFENPELSRKIKDIVDSLGYNVNYSTEDGDDEKISITVMDLRADRIEWGALNPHKKSYPASAYKVFVAAELYRRVAEGTLSFEDMIFFDPKNNRGDDTVKGGEKYSVRYLMNNMLELSDNSCANQCIDIAGRKKINELLHQAGIMDSDVTRKYLPRSAEDEEYKKAPSTFGTSYDYAYFYALLGKGKLINKAASRDLYNQLLQSKRNFAINGGLPQSATFAHKIGYYGDFNIDAGIVKDGKKFYSISIFFPENTEKSNPKVHEIVKKIHEMM